MLQFLGQMAERVGENGFGEWHYSVVTTRNHDLILQSIGAEQPVLPVLAHRLAALAGKRTTLAPPPLAQ